MKWLLFLCLGLWIQCSALAEQKMAYWKSVGDAINTLIVQSQQQYRQGKPVEAKRSVVKAYFGIFEDKKMESAMRIELGAKYTFRVEKKFGKLRKLISKKAPYSEIKALAEDILKTIQKDAKKLDEANIPPEVFVVDQ